MVEAKKSGKKSVLKALRLKPGVQKSGDIDQAGKVSNVIGKWKMKANNKSKENLNSLTPPPEIKKTPVIKNLQRLVIRREDLDNARRNVPKPLRPPPRLKPVIVRRMKKQDKNLVTYAVLKKANEDFVLPPVGADNNAGPRFNSDGKFISYSILGSLTDFKRSAQERGQFRELFMAKATDGSPPTPTQGEKPCSSLKQWSSRVGEWNELHKTLSRKADRLVSDLIMRTPNEYPENVNQREIINMATEAAKCGHEQKRESANFFKLCNKIGRGEFPVFSTIGKSVKNGYTQTEVRNIPDIVDQEKGTDASSLRRQYPVYYTPYLQTRAADVRENMCKKMFIPDIQELKKLQVAGKVVSDREGNGYTKPTHTSVVVPKDTISNSRQNVVVKNLQKTNGPAIMVGYQVLHWQGHGLSRKGQTGIRTSLLFDGYQNETLHQNLRLENVGTTRLLYGLQKIPYKSTIDVPRSKTQRFFCLTEGGVLAPGEVVYVPIICNSKIAGIFHEKWVIKTMPVLDCGSDIVIKVTAFIHSRENYLENFAKIEETILQQKAATIVSEVVGRLVDSICSPDPPSSPISDVSPEEQFSLENPGLVYHSSTLRSMEKYHSLLTENIPSVPEKYQEFSLPNLRKVIIMMTEIQEGDLEDPSPLVAEMDEGWDFTKRRLLWRYLRLVDKLGCVWPEPTPNLQTIKLQGCFSVFASVFDRFSDRATQMAAFYKLPIRLEEEDQTEKTNDKKSNNKGGKQKNNQAVSRAKKGRETSSPMRVRTPTQRPSSIRGNRTPITPTADDQADDVMESLCPVVKEGLEKEKYEVFKNKLYELMYAELDSAVGKMMMLCDNKC